MNTNSSYLEVRSGEGAKTALPKERPILFSAPMVRALLAGTKTQTRRAIKPQPPSLRGQKTPWACVEDMLANCPYGNPGERLWVREAHYVVGEFNQVFFRADGSNSLGDRLQWNGPWKPGIHMFRRHSRILLEVTEVRVQRLQEIGEADAQAEGITAHRKGGWCWEQPPAGIEGTNHFGAKTARAAYMALWEQIHGPGSWDANPWCWAVSFRRISP